MRFSILIIILACMTWGCSSDEKPADFVLNNTTRGAILRNVEHFSSNFINNSPDSTFEVLVEQQGKELDYLRLYVSYTDREDNGNGLKSQEVVLKDIIAGEFYNGPVDLPRRRISISFQEVSQVLGLNFQNIRAGDQFELRAEVVLKDGRSFSTETTSPTIINSSGFYKSPFKYVINVIDPISDNPFTGTYFYEVLSEDLPLGAFESGNAQVRAGLEQNQRIISLSGFSTRFTIAGNFLYPKIYGEMQSACPAVECTIYSGPDERSFGQFDRQDDTSFRTDVLIGYENWTGDLGQTPPYLFTIQLTKQ